MPLLRAILVFALACSTIGLPNARAQAAAASESTIDAAAWGPYVRLVERSWQLGDGYHVTWQWLSPGQELREQWINPNDGKVIQTNVIRPGDAPGRLLLTSSLLGMNLKWQGRIASADDVVWAREGMVKLPYRLRFAADGQVLYEGVKLKNEQVTDVKYTHVMKPMDATIPTVVPAATITAGAPPAMATPAVPAAVHPASATTATPVLAPVRTPAEQAAHNFGPLTRFNGRRLVGDDDMLEVQVLAPDTLALQFFGPDGKRWNRYLIRARADASGKLELLETAIAKNSRPDARLGADDSLYVESQDGWFSGWRYAYSFTANGDAISTVKTVEFMNGLRIALNDGATVTRAVYRPLTQQRVVQAMETSRQNAENERIAQENRRRAQADQEATWNAALQGFGQGVAQASADQQYAQSQQDAFLAQTAAQSQAIAAQAQRQRDEDARRAQALVAASQRQAPVVSAPGVPSTSTMLAASTPPSATDTAAAEAERRRKVELAEQERKRDAEAKQLAAEQAKQRQQQEWQQSLLQARNSLQLRADTCIGGSGRYYVIGPKTSVKGCVTVHYEARCPGVAQGAGVQGTQHNYIGGSCMGVGDAIAIPGSPLSCPVEQVTVRVTDVTGC